jgi:phosphopantetheinyl transferase (holo-ACP synthase)
MSSNKDIEETSSIQEEKDKRELLQRSPGSKKYVTIISQDFFQKSSLSLEAMGLISYLMSLPDDWIVYNQHLQKIFKIGRDKLRKIMKELKENGYMQRIPVKDDKGRVVTWKTQYSDYPEFLRLVQVTENPLPGNPCPGKQPLQINNNTEKTNYKKTTQQRVQEYLGNSRVTRNQFSEQSGTVVVSLLEKVQQWAIAETLVKTWLKQHSAEYILEKIEYTKTHSTTNPAGFLRKAIEHDYKKYLANDSKQEQKPPIEQIWPSHEENLAWYWALTDEEKQRYFDETDYRHRYFKEMLKLEQMDVKSVEFLKSSWFKMMMQILGRAKQ